MEERVLATRQLWLDGWAQAAKWTDTTPPHLTSYRQGHVQTVSPTSKIQIRVLPILISG